ncbi:response regulator [Pararhodospirillum oryzae]|uniref:Response regulator n=1 Tax=Pararhodospirillum oryzae TaxID=478448 RepID=A0A512HCD4_9PROT|nr:response regulator [Pararhodospirillum oryzae]GEO83040.1 response regulator [Pararhodospirillum oryzae]
MKILVVDDDALAGELTGAVLEDAGYEVVLATNAMEAMEALDDAPAEAPVALIVSDMHMPMISGIELFQTLRDQAVMIPFVLLTGDDPRVLHQSEPRLDACLLKDPTLEETLPGVLTRVLTQAGR